MARDNSLTQQDDQNHQQRRTPTSVHFEDELEKSPDPGRRHEETKRRRSALIQEDHDNSAAWQIDSREKLMTEIDRDPDGVLSMILDMRKTYTEYLDQANEADNQRNQIRMRALGLEQDLHISNEEREQAVMLLQKQANKLKQ